MCNKLKSISKVGIKSIFFYFFLAVIMLESCKAPEKQAEQFDLVVLTSHPKELSKVIIDEFREQSGLKVLIVSDGTGVLLAEISRGERPEADVLWGGGAESIAANKEQFAPYISPERQYIMPGLYEPDGLWTGFTVLPMVIIFNSRLIEPSSAPKRWKDLLSPAFFGSLAFADPASSGSAYTILRTMLLARTNDLLNSGDNKKTAEDRAWIDIATIKKAMGTKPFFESSRVARAVASGEFLIGLTFESAGAEAISLGSDLGMVYPLDGTSAVPDCIAILKNAPHPETAKRFVDFAISKDTAAVLAASFKRRSARFDVDPPAGLPALDDIVILDYDYTSASSDRTASLEKFSTLP